LELVDAQFFRPFNKNSHTSERTQAGHARSPQDSWSANTMVVPEARVRSRCAAASVKLKRDERATERIGASLFEARASSDPKLPLLWYAVFS
jgi:hypothetical protein